MPTRKTRAKKKATPDLDAWAREKVRTTMFNAWLTIMQHVGAIPKDINDADIPIVQEFFNVNIYPQR